MGKGRLFPLALTWRYQSIAFANDISLLGDRWLRVDSSLSRKELRGSIRLSRHVFSSLALFAAGTHDVGSTVLTISGHVYVRPR
jgi:hypothetical protein